MKKVLFLLIAASGSLSSFAKGHADSVKKNYAPDHSLPKWVIDANLMGGMFMNEYKMATPGYTNALNQNISALKFDNGMAYGINAQVGYFFSRNNHWGVGTGIMYMRMTGDAMIDKFHVEYQSVDGDGNTFRQLLTANQQIKEQLKISTISIPVVLKYKHRFTRRVGLAIDAGALINVQTTSAYTTNASFDYEAIYKYNVNGSQVTAVYDNSPVPSNNSLQITKAHYNATSHPEGADVNAYFNEQRSANGYNVGLGVKSTNNSGIVTNTGVTVGVLVKPSINFYLSNRFALDFGVYYAYMPGLNDADKNYRMTNGMGEYNSALRNSSSSTGQSYGLNIGARYYFGKIKDRDHDGIADRKDWCPDDSGLAMYHGCSDNDGDGIYSKIDSCPNQAGLAQFNGCPDTDGDGIPDNEDACPYQAGFAQNNGCPVDTDGDGVPDADDKCPTVAGPASNHGCPVDVPKPEEPKQPLHFIDVSTPILFELGKAKIAPVSFPVLEEAVMEMSENPSAFIVIDGHTDATGSAEANRALSFRRANAVKSYLMEMGADAKRMIAVGHGEDSPVESNDTPEGRAKNRRVIMTVKHRREK